MAELVTASLAAARAAIRQRLTAIWADETPIHWPGTRPDVETGRAYLKLDFLPALAEAATFGDGTGLNRQTELIQLTVFAPAGRGTAELESLAGKAKSVFSRYFGGGLDCAASGVANVALPANQSGWLAVAVTTRVVYYEQTAA